MLAPGKLLEPSIMFLSKARGKGLQTLLVLGVSYKMALPSSKTLA
jgi:hypothetical protein